MYTATSDMAASARGCPTRRQAKLRQTADIELARRIQAGDQPAFRQLVESHQSRIFRVIYGILHNRADAEEIAQDIFAKVYFSIQSFDCRSTLFSWIYRIAVNECYARLRKRRVKLVFENDSVGDGPAVALQMAADGRPTADRALADRDLVNKLLARVPEEDRVLLLWKEVEGFSVVELAEMTGLNENTVKMKLFRARRKLAELAACLSRPPRRNVNSRN